MFGIGLQELLLIMVVALIVLGPQRLPEVARSLGKFYREIKGSVDEVKTSITKDIASVKELHRDSSDYTKVQTTKKEPSFEEEFESAIKNRVETTDVEREKVSFKKESSEV